VSREASAWWTHDGEGYTVTAEVSGRFHAASFNHPAEYPDVEVTAVEDEEGRDRPELVDLAQRDMALLDRLCEELDREEEGAWLDEMERRADAARDDRMGI
jgi:hypothetical protein